MTETYADLSFTTRPDPESELILWSVSPTGMYARDCHAGSLYAFEALEFLLTDPTTDMGYLLLRRSSSWSTTPPTWVICSRASRWP